MLQKQSLQEMVSQRNILVKLGSAIYIHRKLASDAEKAADAVKYLKSKGVFDKCTK